TSFDILHNANTSTRRRRHNHTPPLTYEVPSIISTSRCESTTNQRNQFASPIVRVSSRRDENSNRDNVNSAIGHSLVNVNDLINITSALNLSASQNNSDLSMPDIGGPLESINEE
ncbi:20500_t:CDS:2, partial [Dentiscutata erythropus]